MSDDSRPYSYGSDYDPDSYRSSDPASLRVPRGRRPSVASPHIEAELEAIFGSDEMDRHPRDPFEERIMTGRNSFDDLRDRLAQEDDFSRPSPRSRVPRSSGSRGSRTRTGETRMPRIPEGDTPRSTRPRTSGTSIADLRRDLAEGGTSRLSRSVNREPDYMRDTGSRSLRDTGPRSLRDTGSRSLRDTGSRSLRDTGSRSLRDTGSHSMRDTGSRPRYRDEYDEPVTPRSRRTSPRTRTRDQDPDERLEALRREISQRRAQRGSTEEPPVRPSSRSREDDQPTRRSTSRSRPSTAHTSIEPDPRIDTGDRRAPEQRRSTPRTRPAPPPPPPRAPERTPVVEEPQEPFDFIDEEDLRPPRTERGRKKAARSAHIEAEQGVEPVMPAFEEPPGLFREETDDVPIMDVDEEPEVPAEETKPTKRRGRKPKTEPAPAPPAPAKTATKRKRQASAGDIIEVSSVSKSFGQVEEKVEALRGVDVVIGQGQLTALMGSSGSGKSSLLHCMAGVESPTTGTIIVAGQNISAMKEKQLAKFRRTTVGFVFQAFGLLPTLSTAENLRLPLILNKSKLDSSWFDKVVGAFHLGDALHYKPAKLTPGQQQRVACARAMMSKPSVIFADEPTGELNKDEANELIGMLSDCVTTLDQTIVIATHDPAVAASADRVIVMEDGAVKTEIDAPTLNRVMAAWKSLAGGQA
ncbi:MAG: ATP-binding cassette domain-containing protein [Propionibacteriaceae bacterium]|nr:ATP-binding cassette domain-containing protein [Propionibacteriaceae bacterium]